MKGTFFNKPLEWNIETQGESWQQGEALKGVLKVKNHGDTPVDLKDSGVGLALADIKKVQSRAEGAFKSEKNLPFSNTQLAPQSQEELSFCFDIGPNGPVTDKKSSYYLTFGKNFSEGQLQLKIAPKNLYLKVVGLLDTFYRFKLKEYKAVKKGVEFKLLPPTSREMANIESLLLIFSMQDEDLVMRFDFQVKKLDTSSVTTKINKESVVLEKVLPPKEYSYGKDLINQDQLLRRIEEVISEVKIKDVF